MCVRFSRLHQRLKSHIFKNYFWTERNWANSAAFRKIALYLRAHCCAVCNLGGIVKLKDFITWIGILFILIIRWFQWTRLIWRQYLLTCGGPKCIKHLICKNHFKNIFSSWLQYQCKWDPFEWTFSCWYDGIRDKVS